MRYNLGVVSIDEPATVSRTGDNTKIVLISSKVIHKHINISRSSQQITQEEELQQSL